MTAVDETDSLETYHGFLLEGVRFRAPPRWICASAVGRSRPDAPAAQRTASLPVADFHRRPGRLLPDRRPI